MIEKYKTIVVVKGYKQTKKVDYFDVYAPVARKMYMRIIIPLGAIFNLDIYQMDVKTDFLNGELEEEIYIEQFERCRIPGQEIKIYKLLRSFYGLKQALTK